MSLFHYGLHMALTRSIVIMKGFFKDPLLMLYLVASPMCVAVEGNGRTSLTRARVCFRSLE